VLNTVLYNWEEEANNEVKIGQGNTSSTSAAAIVPRNHLEDNLDAAATAATAANTDSLFDRKIDLITEGIASFFASKLRELSKDNPLTIIDYILSMKNEINLSDNYRKLNIYALYSLSKFLKNKKTYKELTRDDVLQFLDSLRKPEASDPLHRWIGTYDIYRILFIRLFKWLYHPNLEQKKRPKLKLLKILLC
jgi:hypothetical protein